MTSIKRLKYLIFLSILLINGCAFMHPYQPVNLDCSLRQMRVLEYTRLCEAETYQSWSFCAAQAERLFCTRPDWSKNDLN